MKKTSAWVALFAGYMLLCGFTGFNDANSAYRQGKYDAALEGYHKVLAAGFESGNLYYNVANSYVKKGELGKAILNYEKARLFIPGDSDVRSNYEYALSLTNGGQRSFGNHFEKLCERLFDGMTPDSLAILLSAMYILVIAGFVVNLFLPAARQFTRPLAVILTVLFLFAFVAFRQKTVYSSTGAVVISKEADVKFEPLATATTYFKLFEGSNVEIVEKGGAWYKIKRPDGKTGWMEKTALGRITGTL
jgi:tetratricopeptide (TPR) repeat protein